MPGGSPDHQRYVAAHERAKLEAIKILEKMPEFAQAEQMERQRLANEGRSDLAANADIKRVVAERFIKNLRFDYDIPDAPKDPNAPQDLQLE